MYKTRFLTCGGYKDEIRQLMCDQMKMKENGTTNTVTNETVGGTDSFVCRRKISKKLLDDDNIETPSKPTNT